MPSVHLSMLLLGNRSGLHLFVVEEGPAILCRRTQFHWVWVGGRANITGTAEDPMTWWSSEEATS